MQKQASQRKMFWQWKFLSSFGLYCRSYAKLCLVSSMRVGTGHSRDQIEIVSCMHIFIARGIRACSPGGVNTGKVEQQQVTCLAHNIAYPRLPIGTASVSAARITFEFLEFWISWIWPWSYSRKGSELQRRFEHFLAIFQHYISSLFNECSKVCMQRSVDDSTTSCIHLSRHSTQHEVYPSVEQNP